MMREIDLDPEKLRKVAAYGAGGEKWLRLVMPDGDALFVQRTVLRSVVESMPRRGKGATCRVRTVEHRSRPHVHFAYTTKRGARGHIHLVLHSMPPSSGLDRDVPLNAITA